LARSTENERQSKQRTEELMKARHTAGLLLFAAALAVLMLAWIVLSDSSSRTGTAASPSIERGPAALSPASSVELVAVDLEQSSSAFDAIPVVAQPVHVEVAHDGIAAVTELLRRLLPERYGDLDAAAVAALTDVDLHGTHIGDAELAQLATLPNLQHLGLRGTEVTDAGLAYFSGTPLLSLDLRATGVTASGMCSLPRTLEALHLTETKVAGADLVRLPPLPYLERLKLNSLDLDDSAIEALSLYPSLKHVELDGTAISDTGLRRLLDLNPGLTCVELRRTGVATETIAALSKEHPSCEFVRDNGFLLR
jgi:hypothetical protein